MGSIEKSFKHQPSAFTSESGHVSFLWRFVLPSLRRENLKQFALFFYFFYFLALTAVLLPYITLHMRQVGITIEEVGIIYAVLPFASCLGPPTAGEYYLKPITVRINVLT